MAAKTKTKTKGKTAVAPAVDTSGGTRDLALEYLKTLALDTILEATEPQRITEVSRAVMDRLGVPMTEEEAGGLASVIRLILDSDPRFAQSNRMWDLALRMGRAEGDRKKPVERSIEDFIGMFGLPAEPGRIATLTAALYGREPEFFAGILQRIAPVRPQFFLTRDGRVGLTRWLLTIESDDPEDVRFDNFDSDSELDAAAEAARGVAADSAPDLARSIAARSAVPIPFKPVAYQVWERFRDVEAQALFNDLLEGDGALMLPGPVVASAEHHAAMIEAMRALCRDPESAVSMLAETTPVIEEGAALPSVTASEADVDQVYDFMEREPLRSYRVPELCQVVLETFPGSRSYAGMHETLLEKMRQDHRFVWVGNERFRIEGMIPEEVQVLPEGLAFDERAYVDEESGQVDKLSPPEAWKYGLAREVQNPLVLDVGDDDSEAGPALATLRKSLLLHHYFAGTAYVPHPERSFFGREPDLIELALITPEGDRLEVWFNHRLGLLFGLRSWFEALDAQDRLESWSGPVFEISPTSVPDEFKIEYRGEMEPLTSIPRDRLPQLFGDLRAEAEAEGWPLTTIVSRILKDYPEGLPFIPIFTQVNIVRRARRDAVASVLSAQRFFTQNPQQPGHIRFDEKRAEKKAKKRAPRHVEEYDEEEDLEIE